MKRLITCMMMLVCTLGYLAAQEKEADIKFESTVHDFGTFPESSPIVTYVFTFTNVGDGPLVIHQAIAPCGCTVPEYTQEPVLPGKTGTIKVTYNGTGRRTGFFRKKISLYTNAKTERVNLYIEGTMEEKK